MKKRRSLKKNMNGIIVAVVTIILIMQFFYFAYLSSLLQQQKQKNIDDLIVRMDNQIENYINTAKQMQNFIQYNNDVWNLLGEKEESVRDAYRVNIQNSIPYQDENAAISIIVYDEDGRPYYFLNEPDKNEIRQIQQNIPKRTEETYHEDTRFFTVDDSPYSNLYICTYAPINVYDTKVVGLHSMGVVVVVNRLNAKRIVLENDFNSGVRFTLTSLEDEIVFDINYTPEKGALFSEKQIRGTTWRMKGEAEQNRQDGSLSRQRNIIMAEIFIIAVMMIAMQMILNNNIAKPAEQISKFLDAYSLNNGRGHRLQRLNTAEFDAISGHINNMLEKMETMARNIVNTQQRLYELEISENKATIYALQNQINPHFLYNTLDCIAGIAVVSDQKDIYNIVIGISDILRYTLIEGNEVCVEDEIAVIEKYISIQKIRFPDGFEVELDIEDDIWSVGIIRMCLQPIVENAFKYSLVSAEQKGLLTIRGYIEGDAVKISVRDNGNGMPEQSYQELLERLKNSADLNLSTNGKGGLGLINIDRRLKLKYGKDYGLFVRQQEGAFMEIIVTIPYKEK